MKKLIKLGSLIVAITMTASILMTGCEAKKKEPPAETSNSTSAKTSASTESKPDLSKKVTLKFYTNNVLKEDEPKAIEEINKILSQKLNTTLDVEGCSSGDQYNLIVASGQEYDMIFTASWKNYGVNASKNAFKEITEDMLQKYAPNLYKSIPKSDWDLTRVNKKIYMIPQSETGFDTRLVTIRSDLRKKYNVPEIKSLKDLEAYMEAIVKNEKDMVPINMVASSEFPILIDFLAIQNNEYARAGNDVRSFGWGWYKIGDTSSSKIYNSLELPEFAEALKKVREWNQKGYIAKSALTNSTVNQQTNMQNGKTAVLIQNYGTGNGVYNNTKVQHPDWSFELIDLSNGKKVLPVLATSGGVAIGANSKNADRVLMVVDLIRSDKELNYLAQRGIKGKNWDVAPGQSNENIVVPGPDAAKFGSGFTWGAWRTATYQPFPDPKNSIPGYMNAFDSLKSRAAAPVLMGFNFNSTALKAEIGNLAQVEAQYGLPLIGGYVDPVTGLATYKEKLKAAGYDKVLEEMQKQADDYVKNLK